MALISSILQHAKSHSSSKISTYIQRRLFSNDVRKENIVIVGAGIAGLASALSLQRFKFSLSYKFAFSQLYYFMTSVSGPPC